MGDHQERPDVGLYTSVGILNCNRSSINSNNNNSNKIIIIKTIAINVT